MDKSHLHLNILACTIVLLSLSACGTINGAGKDFQNWGNYLDRNFGDDSSTNENQAYQEQSQVQTQEQQASELRSGQPMQLTSSHNCPDIILKPLMSTLVEFENPNQTSDEMKIATAEISRVRSTCQKNTEFMTVSIDLNIDTKLGPKARRNSNDKPFFSFPYFISVTDVNGTELAKEVFGASFSFETNQSQITHNETIEQNLPLNPDGSIDNYYMEIGFELTNEQMNYNNSHRSYF